CGAGIGWHDNCPVVSYLRLGGRCRDCRSGISVRYPVIELLFGLIVLMLVDAFCVAHARPGLIENRNGLSWQIIEDGPLLTAHLILFAALLGMSAIDMEHYWVDIRATGFATGCGFVLHAVWTPRRTPDWPRPDDGTALVCLGALAGLALIAAILRLRYGRQLDLDEFDALSSDGDQSDPAGGGNTPPEDTATEAPDGPSTGRRIGIPITIAVLLAVLLVAAVFDGAGMVNWLPFSYRALAVLLLLFGITVSQSMVTRDSDQEIFEAIESERGSARLMSLIEFGCLTPALLVGAIVAAIFFSQGAAADILRDILHWAPTRDWQPVWGLGTAAAGFVIGGGIGWAVRLIFTVALGKEAFGTGDIHMMAAAGCVAGWPVALGGFVAACLLALVAIVISLPFKRTRTIPLGPWLSLGFLIMVVFYEPVMQSKPIRNLVEVVNMVIHGSPAY
ncbi:MAG: A24 family peptidase, partial [Planctomycetes bacterium]|nr:A24 family peptidase [Planctomycetota bacterium]